MPMALTRQHRMIPRIHVRMTPDGSPGRFEAVVLNYNVVDDYRTIFLPGVFDESMDERMPRVVWSHDWSEPLGRYISYTSTSTQLTLVGEFDDMAAVPRAAQAYAQLKSGTIDQFSVGFLPLEMSMVQVPLGNSGEQTESVDAFVKGRLDEVSLVLVGAVPDTELLSVRMGAHPGRQRIIVTARNAVVDMDLAASILLDLQTGKTDLADALMKLKSGASEPVTATVDPTIEPPVVTPPEGQSTEQQEEAPKEPDDQEPGPTQEAIDLQAEIEAALAVVDSLA